MSNPASLTQSGQSAVLVKQKSPVQILGGGSCEWCYKPTQNPRFCSISCGTKHQYAHAAVPIMFCEYCKKSYDCRSKSGGKRKYCSQSCAASVTNKLYPKRKKTTVIIESDCLNCGLPTVKHHNGKNIVDLLVNKNIIIITVFKIG